MRPKMSGQSCCITQIWSREKPSGIHPLAPLSALLPLSPKHRRACVSPSSVSWQSHTPMSSGYLHGLRCELDSRLMALNYVNSFQRSPSNFLDVPLKGQGLEGSPPQPYPKAGWGRHSQKSSHSLQRRLLTIAVRKVLFLLSDLCRPSTRSIPSEVFIVGSPLAVVNLCRREPLT